MLKHILQYKSKINLRNLKNMATVVSINLSSKANKILRVIGLYPLVPLFQGYFGSDGYPVTPTPDAYVRDSGVISAGFPS